MSGREAAAPAAGRTRMLDAAEFLFASKGFDGTSVRDITQRARVEVGLLTYHFKTKANLFRETMLRRAPEFAQALCAALDVVLADTARADPRAILAAYLDPHVALVQSGDAGWRSYIRLAAEAMLRSGNEELTGGATAIYRPVMRRYEDVLIDACPAIEQDEVRRTWAIYRRTILSVLVGGNVEGEMMGGTLAPLRETTIQIFADHLAGRTSRAAC